MTRRLEALFPGQDTYNDESVPSQFLQDFPRKIFWRDFQCYMRGESERASSLGALYLTNIQQFYERVANGGDEPVEMTAVLGQKPPGQHNRRCRSAVGHRQPRPLRFVIGRQWRRSAVGFHRHTAATTVRGSCFRGQFTITRSSKPSLTML